MRVLLAGALVVLVGLLVACSGGAGGPGQAPATTAPVVASEARPDDPWPECAAIRADLRARYPNDRPVVLLWDDRTDAGDGSDIILVIFGFANRLGHFSASYRARQGSIGLLKVLDEVNVEDIRRIKRRNRPRQQPTG